MDRRTEKKLRAKMTAEGLVQKNEQDAALKIYELLKPQSKSVQKRIVKKVMRTQGGKRNGRQKRKETVS